MNKALLALYGLKYNPFSPQLPTEALMCTEALEAFAWRIENTHVREGGFALITGVPGTGKSVALRILAARLEQLPELTVAALTHPSANLADFYRELGDLFAVELRPHNRWMGFKARRARWMAHLDTSLMRPVAQTLLSVILAGDQRLTEQLRREELLPLGSRIRARLTLERASREELLECLEHLTRAAGNPALFSPELARALAEHAMGNFRVLTNLAAECLAYGARHDIATLDEKVFFAVFHPERKANKPRRAA
jgi:type II secretory pathway predicted ATPase ExeA